MSSDEHGERVPGPGRPARRGQRDVDGLLDQHPLLVLDLELGLPGRQRLVDGAPGLADALAGVLAGLRRQRADLAVGQRQRRPVAGVVDADLLEARQVLRPRDGRKGLVAHLLDLVSPQGRDLDGVVGRVGAGHAPQSRKAGPAPANRLLARRDLRSARARPRFHASQSSSDATRVGENLGAQGLGQRHQGRVRRRRRGSPGSPGRSCRSPRSARCSGWAIQASGLIAAMPSSPSTPVTSANRGTQVPQRTSARERHGEHDDAQPALEDVDHQPGLGEAVGLLVEVHPVQRRDDDDQGQRAEQAERDAHPEASAGSGPARREAAQTTRSISRVATVSWPKPWCTYSAYVRPGGPLHVVVTAEQHRRLRGDEHREHRSTSSTGTSHSKRCAAAEARAAGDGRDVRAG